jgi:hypothetical protein
MVTLTPPKLSERGIESALAVAEARLVPKTEISEPGVTAALGAIPKLAPLVTPPAEIAGAWAHAAEATIHRPQNSRARFTQ